MFKNEEILEFLTRIIKNSNNINIEDSKESIEKFKEYLELTTMCDESTINGITTVVNCFEDLVHIYEKTGICDLTSIFNSKDASKEKPSMKVKKRTFDKKYQEKHYDRYIPVSNDYGSSCGSSSSKSSSSCSSSSNYGSSCGSSGSYGSRC